MDRKAQSTFSILRYLVPKNNSWAKRMLLLFAFIFFDYAVTLILCKNPLEEANLHARNFMEQYGIFFGLTMFNLIMNVPIYVSLSLDSHVVNLSPKLSRIVGPSVDIIFAWFIAGSHFSGAASWFWLVPHLICQAIGTILYLLVAFTLLRSS